jgi:hypothetical protein
MKNNQDLAIVYQEIVPSEEYTDFNFISRLDDYYAYGLDSKILELNRKRILLLFVINAYYPSFREIMKTEYKKFSEDFSEYLDSAINNKILREDNIFAIMNKDWYNATNQGNNSIEEFDKEYNVFPSQQMIMYVEPKSKTVRLTSDDRKYIDETVKKFKERYSEKIFYSAVVPYKIPFQYVITSKILDEEFSVVYWQMPCHIDDWEVANSGFRHGAEIKEKECYESYMNNLKKLLSYDFGLNSRKKILIIFIYDGYWYAQQGMAENEYLGVYEKYRVEFREYLESVINNQPLPINNNFTDMNEGWYSEPLGNINNTEKRPVWKVIRNLTMETRKLIDEYVEKLRKEHKEKSFYHMVVPVDNVYSYTIL